MPTTFRLSPCAVPLAAAVAAQGTLPVFEAIQPELFSAAAAFTNVFADVDADGDLDAAVANMDGDANGLFRNAAGKFTDVADTGAGQNHHDSNELISVMIDMPLMP